MNLHDETEDRPIIPEAPRGLVGRVARADRPGRWASDEAEPKAKSTKRVEGQQASAPRGVTTGAIVAPAGDEGSLIDVLTDEWANGSTRAPEVAAS